mmetsp:Transcript_34855/g.45886  ORF Transcript_34855/g.45886 Transcript_34855/m.45886 type:complete len:199 (-) Transcript_34855:120-716(-)
MVYQSEKEVEQSKQEMNKMTDVLRDLKAQNQITLTCLLQFSDIKQDKFDDIMNRIIFAFGIDYRDPNSRVDFDMYVRIKCFMKYYTISKEDLTKMWFKIINPSANVSLPKDELEDLFERFARGKIQSQKILVSAHFSENMIKLLEREGCENPEEPKEILMSEVNRKIEDGTINIELFNQMIKTECSFKVWSAHYQARD